ncbi:MAG: SIMPL domain-containing protein, partial [Pseudomonadota bacterium]
DYQVETGFTGIGSEVKRSEACLNHNRAARQRHRQILADYRFNQRLDRQGDTQTRRRIPRPRIAEKVCAAEEIRVFTRMVVRIQPADVAGDVLVALGDAGAEDAQLLGYDFSNYDSLYQTAAARAVDQAKRKAEAVAKGAGGTLGELLEIDVDRPERLRRFGPQPRVVRAPRPRTGDGIPALVSFAVAEAEHELNDDVISVGIKGSTRSRSERRVSQLAASPPPPPAVAFSSMADVEETVTVTGARLEPVTEPAQTANFNASGNQTNALAMTLMSGPQIIRVSARLSYDYATPLDGMILTDGDDPA